MAQNEMKAEILIIGAGTGGVAAALSASDSGRKVILTEPTDWIGGQLTSQAVPPDENPWIETHGCTRRYRALREGIRQYYRDHFPLTADAKAIKNLNPGGGGVSKLCHEPRVSVTVLEGMLAPHRGKNFTLLLRHTPIRAEAQGDRVRSVTFHDAINNSEITITADYFLDATELGDLLPMTGTEYVSGAESQKQTGEPHAPSVAQPDNVQSYTWCFPAAFDPTPGASHIIDKPKQYERWRDYAPHLTPAWPGKLLSWTYTQPVSLQPHTAVLMPQEQKGDARALWNYRKIVRNDIYEPGRSPHEVTLVNWPQNDYWEHNVIDKPSEDVAVWLDEAKQLSLSLMFWMQTEAPRADGGVGYPGLYLKPDVVGTKDGLAMAPYFRESRRIKAVFTVTENYVGVFARYGVKEREASPTTLRATMQSEIFPDTVGIGYYRIDLHPTAAGNNYLDISSLPFQIPLGALIPQRMTNLLPACKNIGSTHITNGCYRLHPIEWNIGEAAGALAAFALEKNIEPRAVRERKELLSEFQALLKKQGFELEWPKV